MNFHIKLYNVYRNFKYISWYVSCIYKTRTNYPHSLCFLINVNNISCSVHAGKIQVNIYTM